MRPPSEAVAWSPSAESKCCAEARPLHAVVETPSPDVQRHLWARRRSTDHRLLLWLSSTTATTVCGDKQSSATRLRRRVDKDAGDASPPARRRARRRSLAVSAVVVPAVVERGARVERGVERGGEHLRVVQPEVVADLVVEMMACLT